MSPAADHSPRPAAPREDTTLPRGVPVGQERILVLACAAALAAYGAAVTLAARRAGKLEEAAAITEDQLSLTFMASAVLLQQ